jgi:hypothetical protein
LKERRAGLEKQLATDRLSPDGRDDPARMLDSISRELRGAARVLSPVAQVDVVKARELQLSLELGQLYRTLTLAAGGTGLATVEPDERRRILQEIKSKQAELASLANAYSFFKEFSAVPAQPKKKQVRKSPYKRRRVNVPAVMTEARLAEIRMEAKFMREAELEPDDQDIVETAAVA